MPKNKLSVDELGRLIYEIRGQRVMLDSDLAAIYGVATKVLNRAVKRNPDRFPKDFVFQLTRGESEVLRYQFGTLKNCSRNSTSTPLSDCLMACLRLTPASRPTFCFSIARG